MLSIFSWNRILNNVKDKQYLKDGSGKIFLILSTLLKYKKFEVLMMSIDESTLPPMLKI